MTREPHARPDPNWQPPELLSLSPTCRQWFGAAFFVGMAVVLGLFLSGVSVEAHPGWF